MLDILIDCSMHSPLQKMDSVLPPSNLFSFFYPLLPYAYHYPVRSGLFSYSRSRTSLSVTSPHFYTE